MSHAEPLPFVEKRWGDAPIHSIAAALFAGKNQLHFFRDIGYRHEHFQHGPMDGVLVIPKIASVRFTIYPPLLRLIEFTSDYAINSCLPKYDALFSG